MQAIGDFFTWLFGTRTGVIALVIGGIFLCLIIAMLMERKTKSVYFNHEKSDDDWSLFDDDDEDESRQSFLLRKPHVWRFDGERSAHRLRKRDLWAYRIPRGRVFLARRANGAQT